ncbi:MAG TPA: translation initiation factor IF-3 [Candidatus Woesebacteria bacterium]|nr:translation initiation factor IF-3 [Candidatus Woesebacteria bacterium]
MRTPNKNYNRFNRNKQPGQFYYLNYRIQADQLRVIDSEGNLIGILSRDEAVKQAQAQEMDLVLIAPHANPPVAKITDFKKFLYTQEKKQREAKKGAKKSTVKDIQISLFIGAADLERMVEKAKEFLEEGNQVRLNLAMRGREVMKKDMGYEVMKKFITNLGEVNLAKEPRLEGRVIRSVISPKK